MRGWLGCLVLLGAACSPAPDGALRVVVHFEPGSTAQCVVVQAKGTKSKLSTAPINRKAKTELKVGIKKSAELSGKVDLQAIGYSQEGCPDGTQAEWSAVKSGDLDALGVNTVDLSLDRAGTSDGGGSGDGGTDPDGDGDGYRKSVDCNDNDSSIHPNQNEQCANSTDDNCDLVIDCADPFCAGATCNDNDACTTGEKCLNTACLGAPTACLNPGPCEQTPGACLAGACTYPVNLGAACADGGTCRSDKTCGSGEVNCANGLDDDGDAGADCLDPACANQDCDAGVLLCFGRATCVATTCTPLASSTITCAPPTAGCFSGGTCQPDAGCAFTQSSPGATCPAGSCRADGGCGPVENAALCANGLDDDVDGLVDCLDPSCAGGACNDGNTCTTNTVCAAMSCSGGAAVICPPIPFCSVVDQCLMDGGCTFATGPLGAACGDGGTCTVGGICTFPTIDAGPPDAGPPDAGVDAGIDAGVDAGAPFFDGGFQYVPSNFNPGLAPASIAGPLHFTNCNAVFDTTAGTWPQNCGQPVPTPVSVTQASNTLAWVLPMRGLIIDANASLRLQGNGRPVIIAVYGDADLNGPINARSAASGALGNMGAGGNWSGCFLAGMSGGAGGVRPFFGSGGGGGAFATDGGVGPGSGIAGAGTGGVGKPDPLVPLHGGCPGGSGGGSVLSAGGAGGGGVQLSVAGHLRVNQFISASGGGGRQGQTYAGGGGGGSGGGIFLEAFELELTAGARLTCNGGGGGEGGGQNDPGANGDDGSPIATTPAQGGPVPPEQGNINGGNGGNGAAGPTAATNGATDNNSSGGGGGGLGHVRLRAISTCVTAGAGFSAVVSKNATCP